MRWLLCLVTLLMLPGCDDDGTGPGSGSTVEWQELAVPAVVGEGSVVAMAKGGGRVVALVHSDTGEWVLEETPDGWTPVFDKPLPFPPAEAMSARTVFYIDGSQDLVVSDDGRIYIVGADEAPGGPYGDSIRTPAIWSEGETDWVLTSGPEDAGILLKAEWVPGYGIDALGLRYPSLLILRGTPESGLSWGTHISPEPEWDEYIADMVVEGTSVYVGGSYLPIAPDYTARPLIWRGDGSDFIPLDPPCGECAGLSIGAIAMSGGTVYWGGLFAEPGLPGASRTASGWLAAYEADTQEWTNIELPAEIKQVVDILVQDTTLLLAVETQAGKSRIYRDAGRRFVAEPIPDGGFVHMMMETDDQRVLGAGAWAKFPERGDPLLAERTEESK